jgi:hypothetical protein
VRAATSCSDLRLQGTSLFEDWMVVQRERYRLLAEVTGGLTG